ncbi:MAG: HAD family phosphatase [Phycisphaerae bacterium]|nr:HAD family phosphatase [Phycisphaerae bacterium]
MNTPYGLIFDVDGVIADSERVNADVTIQVFADLFGEHHVQRQDFEAGLGRGAEAYIRCAALVHGLHLTDQQMAAASEARQVNFLRYLSQETLEPFPGVLALMNAALDHPDFRVAIATSSARLKSEAVLKSAQIPYQHMVYITGDEVKSKKPDPELFLRAAQGIHVAPQNCVVIEDAPNGVQAAHAAGCKCIAVTNSTTPDKLSQADRIVSALTEVTIHDIMALLHGV